MRTAGFTLNTACGKRRRRTGKHPGDGKGRRASSAWSPTQCGDVPIRCGELPAPDRAYAAIGNFPKEISGRCSCVNETTTAYHARTASTNRKHFAEVMGGWTIFSARRFDLHSTGGRYGEAVFPAKSYCQRLCLLPRASGPSEG